MNKRVIKLPIMGRIMHGAAFLTRRLGKGWKSKINVDTLDINQPQSCMLGQTDTDFFEHQEVLKISDLQCAHYGFLGYSALDKRNKISFDSSTFKRNASVKEHHNLTQAWKAYLLLAGLE